MKYQACLECGSPQTLERFACRKCGSTRLEWRPASGGGTVYASTVVVRAPSDEFRGLAPYTLVLVDLDEGVRRMGHAAPGLAIGDRVRAGVFEFNGRTLVKFLKDDA
jgi:uncharacterized OB-fold protein